MTGGELRAQVVVLQKPGGLWDVGERWWAGIRLISAVSAFSRATVLGRDEIGPASMMAGSGVSTGLSEVIPSHQNPQLSKPSRARHEP